MRVTPKSPSLSSVEPSSGKLAGLCALLLLGVFAPQFTASAQEVGETTIDTGDSGERTAGDIAEPVLDAASEPDDASVTPDDEAAPTSDGVPLREPSPDAPNLGAEAADLPVHDEPERLDPDAASNDVERIKILEEQRARRYAPSATIHGEYRLRINALSDIPLQTQARTGFPAELGQNFWGSQWLRATGTLSFGERFKLIGQVDLADGLIVGDETEGVSAAELPRDGERAFDGRGVDLRWLYAEWRTPVGVFRAGLQPSHWGLGLIANDGTRWSPFGDYRYGNSNLRLLFATQPGGERVPFTIAIAGDLVFRDPIATLPNDERALQAVLAAFYGDGKEKTIGAYVVYRSQRNTVDQLPGETLEDDTLNVWVLDLFAQWVFEEPSGGEIVAAFEGAHLRGDTSFTRSLDRDSHDVRQWMWAAQLGRRGDWVDGFFEVGYTSGDSNTEDGAQRRATMHPDHRIGLILFPEVLAWHSARSATLAQSDELSARAAPGSQLLPTNGGVSGATYLFNWWDFRPRDWVDIRFGWIWARATSDIVDPYRQRTQSRSVSWLGGEPRSRDLGLELDAMVLFTKKLPFDIELQAGVDGGVFFPGHAFDDADGNGMDPVFLGRLRGGLSF